MIPRRSTAALPPHPLPFFSCATGALAPAFGFAGAGLAAPGFGTVAGFAAGFDTGGAALGAGAGTAGAGLRRIALDLIPVDERAIRRIEVHKYPYAFTPLQLRMARGD